MAENFDFGPYVRLGEPTYGLVHDLRTCFFWTRWFFGPWYLTRWFSVHGIECDGFRSMVLDASTCINIYYNIERNIMKNQAGSPGFGIQWENLCVYVFYVLCSRIVYFFVF